NRDRFGCRHDPKAAKCGVLEHLRVYVPRRGRCRFRTGEAANTSARVQLAREGGAVLPWFIPILRSRSWDSASHAYLMQEGRRSISVWVMSEGILRRLHPLLAALP